LRTALVMSLWTQVVLVFSRAEGHFMDWILTPKKSWNCG
jgi:hypothetical protein